MPDGSYVASDEDHFLMINSRYRDQNRIRSLTDAVRSYGITEGCPEFIPGHRSVTDEEWEEQRLRMEFGLTPDPLDVAVQMMRETDDDRRGRK